MLRRMAYAAAVLAVLTGMVAAEQSRPREVDENGKAKVTVTKGDQTAAKKKATDAGAAKAQEGTKIRVGGESTDFVDNGPQK